MVKVEERLTKYRLPTVLSQRTTSPRWSWRRSWSIPSTPCVLCTLAKRIYLRFHYIGYLTRDLVKEEKPWTKQCLGTITEALTITITWVCLASCVCTVLPWINHKRLWQKKKQKIDDDVKTCKNVLCPLHALISRLLWCIGKQTDRRTQSLIIICLPREARVIINISHNIRVCGMGRQCSASGLDMRKSKTPFKLVTE